MAPALSRRHPWDASVANPGPSNEAGSTRQKEREPVAHASGFTCDYQPCSHFEVAHTNGGPPKLPGGWITLNPHLDGEKGGSLDLCSDKCVVDVAIERYEMNTGKTYRRAVSRTIHSAEFKAQVVAEVADGANARSVAKKHGIPPSSVYQWIKA